MTRTFIRRGEAETLENLKGRGLVVSEGVEVGQGKTSNTFKATSSPGYRESRL